LHFSHIFLTLGRTFIVSLFSGVVGAGAPDCYL
jgi:hypothetical protein